MQNVAQAVEIRVGDSRWLREVRGGRLAQEGAGATRDREANTRRLGVAADAEAVIEVELRNQGRSGFRLSDQFVNDTTTNLTQSIPVD